MDSYEYKVFRRALCDTIGFFGWNLRSLALPVAFCIGLLLFWKFVGIEAAMEELRVSLAFTLAPVGLFAIVLFFWNVATAGDKLVLEAIERIDLTGRSTQAARPQAFVYKKPDQHWRHIDKLKVWQAACLWADIDPDRELAVEGGPAYGPCVLICQAIETKKLKTAYKPRQSSVFHAEVMKEELIKFANSINEKPAFLFGKQE